MKFGLRLPSFALGPDTARLQDMGVYLRRAEDLGFETAMLIDHLLVAPPAYRVTWLEPVSLLAGLAGVTRTIRLGTLVLEERGRRMNEMLEAITALWAGDDVSYEGRYYRFEHLTIEPKPAQKPHPPIWIGGGTQPSEKIYGQGVDTIQPVLRRIAKYASTWVPHSSATAEMVAGDWAAIQGYMVQLGRRPGEMQRVYSNFVHILAPGEKPESAAPKFRVYSGMDLDYWQEFYLLGEAEAVAERVRGKIEALGGVDHLVLNPLDWDPRSIEVLAERVLPLVAAA